MVWDGMVWDGMVWDGMRLRGFSVVEGNSMFPKRIKVSLDSYCVRILETILEAGTGDTQRF